MGTSELRTTRSAVVTPAPPAAVDDWRLRLRAVAYALYRRRQGRSPVPADGEVERLVERLVELIDEGRAEPTAPASLTRLTAEALGGAISSQLCFAAGRDGRPCPEEELVPTLLYTAVLPYIGADAAAEELRAQPPPR